jgi:hypothetical protein
MRRKRGASANFLELKPLRLVQWEVSKQGRAVLTAPKFSSRILVKWLVPLLSKPFFRVRLDEYGSFVWLRCDGQTTVEMIADQAYAEFGESVQPLYERLISFLHKLEREDFVHYV